MQIASNTTTAVRVPLFQIFTCTFSAQGNLQHHRQLYPEIVLDSGAIRDNDKIEVPSAIGLLGSPLTL